MERVGGVGAGPLQHPLLPRHDLPRGEQVAGMVQPGTLHFETESGLVSAGLKAVFKVFVVLTTGNERGSNAVKIERP